VHPSVEEAGSQKSPRDPQRSADKAQEDGDADTEDVDVPQAWHIDLVRLAQMVWNGRLESAWHKVFLQRIRIKRGTEERMLCPPCPEKIELVSEGTSAIPIQKVTTTATA
jgi:hypothetical protein